MNVAINLAENWEVLHAKFSDIQQSTLRYQMKVLVILYSTLREKLPPEKQGRTEVDLPDGCTIQDVIKYLDLSGVFICAVNGQVERNLQRKIKEKDELRFFRPGSGGSLS